MMRLRKILVLLALLVGCGVASPSLAQTPPPAAANDGWEKADLQPMMGKGESFKSTTMITIAYSFIWLMVLGFVASVWVRGGQVRRELDELRETIARGAKKKAASPSEKA
jgi:hypothetical protein